MNNIENHISDSSVYVTFDPSGTAWSPDTLHVQAALAKIGAWAMVDNGLPVATTGAPGIIQIATQEEVTAGVDGTKAVTPLTLEYALRHPEATEEVFGKTRYATNAEALQGTLNTRSITPSALDYVFKNRPSTETEFGSLMVATTMQAQAGVVDNVIMTPKKVKQAIDALTTSYGAATESTQGIVQLATVAQVQAGVIREGFAISPYTFNQLTATTQKFGTVKLASNQEAAALTDATKVLTPAALGSVKANTSQFGIVKLTQNVGSDANTALAANANVVPNTRTINGKPLTDNVTITSNDVNCFNRQESDARYLQNVSSRIVCVTGVVADQGYIPVPYGYQREQCKVIISLYGYLGDTWDGMDGYNIQYNPVTWQVTVRIKDERYGFGKHNGLQVSYMVIGIK